VSDDENADGADAEVTPVAEPEATATPEPESKATPEPEADATPEPEADPTPEPKADPTPEPKAKAEAASTAEAPGAHLLLAAPGTPVRIIGGLCFALSTLILVLLVRRVSNQDFGTENTRVLFLIRAAAFLVPGYPALLGLVTLLTGRRPRYSLNPFGLPFEPWWYSTLGALTWRETKRFFFHPIAYVALGAFLAINGVLMRFILDYYAGASGTESFDLPASYWITSHPYLWVTLAILCPAITMRLLSEEQRLGTLEMLLTAPVTEIQVVLSKFLSAMLFFLIMILLTVGYQGVVASYATDWEWGPVLSAYLGLLLGGGIFMSLGLFFSSITKSQVLAFIFTFFPLFAAIYFFPYLADMTAVAPMEDWIRNVARHVNLLDHQKQMARGIVSFSNLVFYATTTIFFLFLAVRGVESHRWKGA
jgi:ABC-2 type transport system permease protein